MSLRSVKRRIAMFCVNYLFSGTRYFSIKRRLLQAAGYEIGKDSKVVGPVFSTGSLSIGRNCWIGRNLMVHGNGSVEIGDNCDIAPDVTFLTGGHEIGGSQRRAGKGKSYKIHVGNGVWIGARSTIFSDVKIYDGSVIAACSCVQRDVFVDTLVAGVPARVVKELANETTCDKNKSSC